MCCAAAATRARPWWKARCTRGFLSSARPIRAARWPPGRCKAFCSVFDDIVLDTAAGMGAPFEAARAAASLALICITPDPVAQRDGRIVCDALLEGGCEQVRLVINKVPRTLAGQGIRDLDECIDTVGAQLLGVVPYSEAVLRAGATASALPKEEKAARVFAALAARLCGVHAPLIVR